MTRWIARGVDSLTFKTIFNLIDLYPTAKLVSVTAVGDKYNIVYDFQSKLSLESTVYINERVCL